MISTGQLSRFNWAAEPSSTSAARGLGASAQRGSLLSTNSRQNGSQWNGRPAQAKNNILSSSTIAESRNTTVGSKLYEPSPELQVFQAFPEANGSLPAALYRLLDPGSPVDFPNPDTVHLGPSDNRELDKLIAALGRNKATWRRAIMLHEWLLQIGHKSDDRLLTTLIRVCAQHGQIATAIQLYDWMRAPVSEGGAGLKCTVYTYTAAMRAALAGNLTDKALKIWEDAETNNPNDIDCRLCTTLIEVYARRGDTEAAISAYRRMKQSPAQSKLAPTVHAYTAVMRAAAEGGRWEAALGIWDDMEAVGCKPTGHAYAAAISACAAGGLWQRAVALFDSMLAWGIKPDVVSCTALVTALGADGQWERAEKVVEWMLRNDIRPNVRTYTALVSALANAKQWERAVAVLKQMKGHALGAAVEPNAYTYSALLKAMGDHGKWALAEAVFADLEQETLAAASPTTVGNVQLPSDDAMMPPAPSSSTVAGGDDAHINNKQQSGNSSSKGAKVAAFPGMRSKRSSLDVSLSALFLTGHPVSDVVEEEEESLEERTDAANVVASTMASVLDSHVDISSSLAELDISHDRERQSNEAGPQSPNTVLARAAKAAQIQRDGAIAGKTTSPVVAVEQDDHTSQPSSSSSATTPRAIDINNKRDANSEQEEDSSTTSTSSSPVFSYFTSTKQNNNHNVHPLNHAVSASNSTASLSSLDTADHTPRSATTVGEWTSGNAALSGLSFTMDTALTSSIGAATTTSTVAEHGVLPKSPRASAGHTASTPMMASSRPKGPLNEVVCGALMLAYERAGKWKEAVGVLDRARALGIMPNTVMYNTAMSALGKAGQLDAARALFSQIVKPDAVSYETLIAAHGMAGDVSRAEALLKEMSSAGFVPQDYAYCGLIAAYSSRNMLKQAVQVKDRMIEAGVQPTVHVYNALIAACDRGHQYEKAVELSREMKAQSITPNSVTQQLLEGVCREGVKAVENQQAAIAALSAAVAAAGSVMIRAGIF